MIVGKVFGFLEDNEIVGKNEIDNLEGKKE